MLPEDPARVDAPESKSPDLGEMLDFVTRFLFPGPRFLLVEGDAGSGKSTFLRSLVERVPGPKAYVAYHALAPSGSGEAPPTPMLLVDPQREPGPSPPDERDPAHSPLLAFVPHDPQSPRSATRILTELAAHVAGPPIGTVFIDSWDRGSEAYFRSRASSPSQIRNLLTPANEQAGLQMELISTPANIVLAMDSKLAPTVSSTADAVLSFRDDPYPPGVVHHCSITKIRGATRGPTPSVYTLENGRFRSLPPLPADFRPHIGRTDPDPTPAAESIWPGSAAFAEAFGRLRYGGTTAFTISPHIPDPIPIAVAAPIMAHVILSGGRVIWAPAPEVRPARLLSVLKPAIPDDFLRERLRIVSPAGDDRGLGELRSVMLPLTRTVGEGGGTDLRTAISPGVGPAFPEAFRFLRDRPEGTPALYIARVEGVKAAIAAAGVQLDPDTIPAVVAYYTKLARYHLVLGGPPTDPVMTALLPMAETLLRLEMLYGRAALVGVRPVQRPLVLDWPDPKGPYSLVPAA
ncbi:MAG TPA: hypothetical protein VMF04_05840 [Thermoplasmata archaeon]|nr:hypothetical protein [Thermoplasmata archaeon]